MWGNSSKKTSKIDTLIGQNTELRGDVRFSGGLHVDGTVRGNIIAEPGTGSVLSLSERGLIEGEVRVPSMVLNGGVNGDVYASEHVQLAARARIKGNVYYKIIEIARGAEVNGNLIHFDEGAKEGAKAGGKAVAPAAPALAPTPDAKPKALADS